MLHLLNGSDPYAGHTFIQWIYSYMIQIQQLFEHFMPHRKGSTIGWTPKHWRSHVRELNTLWHWFVKQAEPGCAKDTICG